MGKQDGRTLTIKLKHNRKLGEWLARVVPVSDSDSFVLTFRIRITSSSNHPQTNKNNDKYLDKYLLTFVSTVQPHQLTSDLTCRSDIPLRRG